MKMNYHHPKKGSRKGFAVALLGGAVLLLFVALSFFMPNIFSGVLHQAAAPLWNENTRLGNAFSELSALLRSKRDLVLENRELRAALEAQERELLALEVFASENDELKTLLKRGDEEIEGVLGVVIAKPPVSLYDTVVLDIGEEDGIAVGDYLIAPGNIAIGLIEEVYAETALASLFSSPGEKVEVQIGPEAITAHAEGEGNGMLRITLPRGVEVAEGMKITMPHINPIIFGVVAEIQQNPSDAFQEVYFRVPVSFQTVRFVKVIPFVSRTP